ncbi:PorP/SprF family type IX secretion system membrane protein [Maribacter sp. 2307ULW6-5]|uniref:PorP/SprF family type IX secretion system membrane protein n=1 Tax=Maribacter sp. 2307ULW6-5 TaxID=3386275 RepID=UPI0039BCA2A4
MKNFCGALLIFFVVIGAWGQEPTLPIDFRQQNITEYNSSLLNPAFSLDRNNPSSIALWSRWQWQTFDADPTSLFINYTARLNASSAGGVGFFQHNTGIFLNTGAALNYAYDIALGEGITLGVGLNLFGYMQELADTRFFQPNPLQPELTTDFILQMAPGLNLRMDRFSLGITSENLFDYNFTTNERSTPPNDRMFLGMAAYDIAMPSVAADDSAFLRPAVYVKTLPGTDTQVGVLGLLSTSKFWAQAGYNTFYGASVGAGGRFFKRLSFGAVVEFGTSEALEGTDPSFELVTSYRLGPLERKTPPEPEEELIAGKDKNETKEQEGLTEAELLAVKEALREQKRSDRVDKKRAKVAIKEAKGAEELRFKETRRAMERKKDSIARATEQQALAEATERKRQKEELIVGKDKNEITEKEGLTKAEQLAVREALKEQKRTDRVDEKRAKVAVKEAKGAEELRFKETRRDMKRKKDSIARAKEQQALAEATERKRQEEEALRNQRMQEREAAVALAQKRQQDSLTAVRLAAAEQAQKEAEAAKLAQQQEAVTPQPGERYEEVDQQGDLRPGYYLIANVFGTKRYFDIFMADLKKKGLQPRSFYREQNKYNYVYLERYDTVSEARAARQSKFGGKYNEKLWIFRVVGK